MENINFDGTVNHIIIHGIFKVEQCGEAQLIGGETIMVSYAMFNLRVRPQWGYSVLMMNTEVFPTSEILKTKIRTIYQPPKKELSTSSVLDR